MKLIIDIPNEAYNILTEYQVLPENLDLEYFVIHGIPLSEELENLVEVMKKRNRQVGHTDGWYMGGAIMINIVEKRLSELKGSD